MILAIDFDGTIVEHKHPEIGEFKPNAKEVLRRLVDEGYRIILWTRRKGEEQIHARICMHNAGIAIEGVNQNSINTLYHTYPKINADIYIDDKQVGGIPDDWEEIYKMIKSHPFREGYKPIEEL